MPKYNINVLGHNANFDIVNVDGDLPYQAKGKCPLCSLPMASVPKKYDADARKLYKNALRKHIERKHK